MEIFVKEWMIIEEFTKYILLLIHFIDVFIVFNIYILTIVFLNDYNEYINTTNSKNSIFNYKSIVL